MAAGRVNGRQRSRCVRGIPESHARRCQGGTGLRMASSAAACLSVVASFDGATESSTYAVTIILYKKTANQAAHGARSC